LLDVPLAQRCAEKAGGQNVFRTLLVGLTFVTLAAPVIGAAGQAQDKAVTKDTNLRAYVELLRSDVRAQKVAIFTELMEFSEAEDKAFWPLYREYDLELTKINDERVSLIEEYAASYPNVSDVLADKFALKALDLESRRTAVKSKYYDRFKKALTAKTAARFLQVENQLLMIVDLQIASSLPVLK
jgi:hypothetical protein